MLYVCLIYRYKIYSGHCSTSLKYMYHIVTPNCSYISQKLERQKDEKVLPNKMQQWLKDFNKAQFLYYGLSTLCTSAN